MLGPPLAYPKAFAALQPNSVKFRTSTRRFSNEIYSLSILTVFRSLLWCEDSAVPEVNAARTRPTVFGIAAESGVEQLQQFQLELENLGTYPHNVTGVMAQH